MLLENYAFLQEQKEDCSLFLVVFWVFSRISQEVRKGRVGKLGTTLGEAVRV